MINSSLHVTKHSGERIAFDVDKLRQSLIQAGASPEITEHVTSKIIALLYDGIPTREIFRRAHQLLKSQKKNHAAKYALKKAILQLGPTGYPFESFVAEIMKRQGFDTQVGVVIQGQCVTHEVDVFAVTSRTARMVECKFHNRLGYKTDVKVPLYIHSRFNDVQSTWMKDPELQSLTHEGWVVTNAHFTLDAVQYGQCVGLHLMSWDYGPDGNSLKRLIDQYRLYPLTLINTLSKTEKETLMSEGMTLANSLTEHPEILSRIGVDPMRMERISREVKTLCEED